jgi:hypothetical protein
MAVFIERPPVTSSNCYKTMKNASILMKLGTCVDWTITSGTCSILNFLLPWQLISKCCNSSMEWERVKDFSALVTCHLKIHLRPIVVCHMPKIFFKSKPLFNRSERDQLLFVYQTAFQNNLLHKYGKELCLLDWTYRRSTSFVCVWTNVGYQVVASFVVAKDNTAIITGALQIVSDWNSS